jgi:2-phosphosulfolactate phosphatase
VEFELGCEWGLQGVSHLAPVSDAAIVVDVLSFSTAVDIVVANGASVLPYPWKDDSAVRYAEEKQAVLASVARSHNQYSLSPSSLRGIPAGSALVLPSPNGSAICFRSASIPTFAACFRNAMAVAEFVAARYGRVAVIPAGERWDDDSLRPCWEDWVGAGAVLSLLRGSRSPEAESAIAAFESARGDLRARLFGCVSGRELVERGFGCDVELAAELGVSNSVPMLVGDRFITRAE